MLRIVTTRRLRGLESDRTEYHRVASLLLEEILALLRKYGNYIENEIGSGDISYIVGNHLFEFNQFPTLFSGFYIDKKRMGAANFINMIYIAKDMQS